MLMENTYWVFGASEFEDYSSFINSVKNYNLLITYDKIDWNHDEFIALGPITIIYDSPWTDDEIDLSIDFTKSESLTSGLILYKINNESFDFFCNVRQTWQEF